MSLSPKPSTYLAGRLFGRARAGIADVCHRRIGVCPEEPQTTPRAFFDPAELDRILAVQEETTHEWEMARIHGRRVRHGATTAYELRDAVVTADAVYAGGARLQVVHTRPKPLPVWTRETLDEAAFIPTAVSNRYFGHYLTDECVTGLLARSFAPVLTTPRTKYWHEPEYQRLAGTQPRAVAPVRVKRLFMFDDVGQNSHKRARFRRFREQVRSLPGRRRGHGVYVRRGNSGVARVLVNEDEVEACLAAQGFSIVDTTRMSVREIVHELKDAAVFVSVEGSGAIHAPFTVGDRASIVNIMPPARFNAVLKDYTDALDLRFGFVVADPAEGGFRLPVDRLLRSLELSGQAFAGRRGSRVATARHSSSPPPPA